MRYFPKPEPPRRPIDECASAVQRSGAWTTTHYIPEDLTHTVWYSTPRDRPDHDASFRLVRRSP